MLKFISQFLYQILMSQSNVQNQGNQELNLHNQRLKHLQTFFTLKQNIKSLTRHTLFLAIAICDKFFEETRKTDLFASQLGLNRELRVIGCLWVGWKFNQTVKISIKTLLSMAKLKMEFQILNRINFQIPTLTPYATMTNEFHSLEDCHESDRRRKIVIAGQCIKFLIEALKHSSDFSLCGELGPKILRLYRERYLQDIRIRSVYAKIQEKSNKLMDTIKAH